MLHQLETIHIIYLFMAGESAEREARGKWPLKFKKCKKCPIKYNENANKLHYFHLVNALEKEFHGLCKAWNIESGLNYNKYLGRT